MPFVKVKVSCSLSMEQEFELKAKKGEAIELVPGKSEDYLLLEFEDNCRLWLRGSKAEPIGGLPINMEGFHLFDAEHRSSYPLDIAYKAAQLADPDKADLFLKNLQLATIVETRQTTLPEELLSIAVETGIDPAAFDRHISDGSAEAAFREDLQFTRSLGICSLPTFLLQYRDRVMLIGQLIGFAELEKAIQRLTVE